MNINTIPLATAILASSLTAHAGHWQIADGFCHTQSQDGQFTVRIKPGTLGIIEQKPNCNGRGEILMASSNVVFNQTRYPSSVSCIDQTQYRAIQIIQATKDIAAVIATLKESDSVQISTFGARFDIDTSDFAKTCAAIIDKKVADFDPQKAQDTAMESMGYEKLANGQWHKKSRMAGAMPNKGETSKLPDSGPRSGPMQPAGGDPAGGWAKRPDDITANTAMKHHQAAERHGIATLTDADRQRVLAAAKQAYLKNIGDADDAASADWGSVRQLPDSQHQGQHVRVIQYTVYNAPFHTYDSVTVYINDDGRVVNTTVEYLGR